MAENTKNELWRRLTQDDIYALHAFLPELIGLDEFHLRAKFEFFALRLDEARRFRVPSTMEEEWQRGDRAAMIDTWMNEFQGALKADGNLAVEAAMIDTWMNKFQENNFKVSEEKEDV